MSSEKEQLIASKRYPSVSFRFRENGNECDHRVQFHSDQFVPPSFTVWPPEPTLAPRISHLWNAKKEYCWGEKVTQKYLISAACLKHDWDKSNLSRMVKIWLGCCFYPLFQKYLEKKILLRRREGGNPDISNLSRLVSAQRRQGWSRSSCSRTEKSPSISLQLGLQPHLLL